MDDPDTTRDRYGLEAESSKAPRRIVGDMEGPLARRVLAGLVVSLSVLGGSATIVAGFRSPVEPSAAYVDPGNQFRIQVPDGWTVGHDVDGTVLRPPGGGASLKIMPDAGCFEATQAAALEIIQGRIALYSANPEFRVVENPTYQAIRGGASARALAVHSESSSPVYLLLAVVLGPDWATVWTFAGFMNGASELALRPAMNATLESFEPLRPPAASTERDASGRFSIGVHPGWSAAINKELGSAVFDAWVASPGDLVTVAVVSEARSATNSYDSARPILQESLDSLSSQSGYALLEPPNPVQVDGYPAARATITWAPSTYNVVQVLVVLPSQEWGRVFAFVGTMFSWDAAVARSCVEKTIASFDLSAAPPGVQLTSGLERAYPWLQGIALAATGTEALVLGILIVRQVRRRGR